MPLLIWWVIHARFAILCVFRGDTGRIVEGCSMSRWFARLSPCFLALVFLFSSHGLSQAPLAALGLFTGQSDVGSVTPPGTLAYDFVNRTYTIDSAGANLWSTVDGFHFVWKKVSGDISITADVQFPQTPAGGSPPRKALLMFRQTLDPDALYADAAIHGNGETALQYRRNKGDTTQGIEFNIGAPKTLRLEKRGDTITLFVSMHGEPLHQAGASIKLHLEEPFYAGIGACAHNKDAVERATFANLELKPLAPPAATAKLALYS